MMSEEEKKEFIEYMDEHFGDVEKKLDEIYETEIIINKKLISLNERFEKLLRL